MVGPVRPQFVLFGSSIVQFSYSHEGWGSILADIYARRHIIARICWLELKASYPSFGSSFPEAVQPSLVIVYFGGNDSVRPHATLLGPHVPLLEYIENMKKIAIHLKSLSETTRIIFLSTPPVNEAQSREILGSKFGELGRTNESGKIYSEACIELCQELNVKVIDLWAAIQKRDDWSAVCFTDGIHLSSEGSEIIVKEILKVLKEADWQPSLHWKSLPTEFAEDSPYGFDDKTTLNVSDINFHWKTQWE